MEESFLAEERLLKGYQINPQERKSNPGKGKKNATGSSGKIRKGNLNEGQQKCFQRSKDRFFLSPKEVEERVQ
jgi:hypothetical protein